MGGRPVANLASIWLTTSVLVLCTLASAASASHAQPAAATHLSSQLARHISRGVAVPADSRIARLVEAEQLAVAAPTDARRPLPAPVAGSAQVSAADSPFKKQQQARQMVQQRLAQQQQQQQQQVQPLQQKQEQPQQQPQQQHQKQKQRQQTLLKQPTQKKQQPQQQQQAQKLQEQPQQQAAGNAAVPGTAQVPPPIVRTDAQDATKADAAASTGSLPSQPAQASDTTASAVQPDNAAEGSKQQQQQQQQGTAAANAVNTIIAGSLPGSSTAPAAAAPAVAQPAEQQQQGTATANAVKALVNTISGGPDSSTAGAAAAPAVVQPAENQPAVAAKAQEPASVLSGLTRAEHPEVWLLLRMPDDSMGAFAQSSLKELDALPAVPASAGDKGSTSSAAPAEQPAPAPEAPVKQQDGQQAAPASNTSMAGEAQTVRQGASAEQQPSTAGPSPAAPADSKNATGTPAEQEEWVEVWVEEEEEGEAEAEVQDSAVGANAAAANATQQAPLSTAAAFLDGPSMQGGGVEPASFSSFARAKARAQAYRQHVQEEAEEKKAEAQYHAAQKEEEEEEEEEALAVAAPEVPGKAHDAQPYEPKAPQAPHYEHKAEEEPEHWYYPGEADDLTADPCARPLLSPPFFDRHNTSSLNNAYVAMLLARYAYPAALGVSGKTEEARGVYQDLYRHKWEAMGALPGSIKFCEVEGSSGHGGKLMMGGGGKKHPDAHAVVFATASDVWVSFRGITDLDTALHSDMKAHATHVHMGGKRIAVHSSYYYAYKAVWPQVAAAVKAALLATRDPAHAHIYLTGHGLGAAQATFTAVRLADMRLKNVGGLWLFGAPQMGQKTFVKAFKDSRLPRITHNWWNELDMVPALGSVWPLKRHHYAPLPATTLHRIWDGQCEKAYKSTARTCVDRKRCKTSSTDHKAVAYATQLQSCVLRQPEVAHNHCLADKVLNSM